MFRGEFAIRSPRPGTLMIVAEVDCGQIRACGWRDRPTWPRTRHLGGRAITCRACAISTQYDSAAPIS